MKALKLTMAVLICVASPVRPSFAETETPATLVPDESYVPNVGDVLTIYRRENGALQSVAATTSEGDFREFQTFSQAHDDTGIKEMTGRKAVSLLDPGTQVRVLEIQTEGITPAITRRIPNMPTVVLRQASQDPLFRYYTVRVVDGPLKDKVMLVDKLWVKRCIAVAAPTRKVAPKSKEASPDRAATLLKSAQNLEKAKKAPGALKMYRDILKSYPDTPAAKTAAERVKALEEK